jgi:hypothetical protein
MISITLLWIIDVCGRYSYLLRAVGFGVRTQVGKIFLFSTPVQIVPETNRASCTMDPGDFTPGVNRPGHDVDHLALSLGTSGAVPLPCNAW